MTDSPGTACTSFERYYASWRRCGFSDSWLRHERDRHSADSWPGLMAQLERRRKEDEGR